MKTEMRVIRAIQVVEIVETESEAQEIFDGLVEQEFCLGGRYFLDGKHETWKVQVFMRPPDRTTESWLPDGCRYVVLPASIWEHLGIDPQAVLAITEGTV